MPNESKPISKRALYTPGSSDSFCHTHIDASTPAACRRATHAFSVSGFGQNTYLPSTTRTWQWSCTLSMSLKFSFAAFSKSAIMLASHLSVSPGLLKSM